MSNVIDDRVVSLEFDNRNFESNVSTTMTTLDRLKAKLNLSGASAGLEKVQNTAKSTPASLEGIASSVAALEQRFSTMGIVGATAISNITTKMMELSSKTLNFLTNGVIQGGISRAMKIEQAKFTMRGLLNDEKAVADIMEDVNYGVSDTAYSLDAAASVAAQLAASGMRAGDGMKAALRGVSGLAAMSNSSYEDIGRIYTQVAGQGKMMGDQLLQFSARGMNVASTMAKYFQEVKGQTTTTEATIRDMVTKGKIDFQTFADAMDWAFGAHAKEANKTFSGSMANIRAALAKIGAEFVTPLIKESGPFVNFFNAIREKINAVKTLLVGDGTENTVNYMKKWGEAVGSIIQGVTDKITKSDWSKFDLKDKTTNVGKMADILSNLAKVIGQVGSAFKTAFSDIFGKQTLKLDGFLTGLQKISESLVLSDGAVDKLTRTFKGLFSVVDLVKKALSTLGNFITSIFSSGAVSGLGELFLTLTSAVGDFFTAINKNVKTDGIIGIFDAIAQTIGSLIKTISGSADGVVSKVSDIFGKLKDVIGKGMEWIRSNLTVTDIMKGLAAGGFIGILQKLTTAIANIFWEGSRLLALFRQNAEQGKMGDIGAQLTKTLISAKNSLNEFTKTLKVGQLVLVAASIAILASALRNLSEVPIDKLISGSGGLLAASVILGKAFKNILSAIDGKKRTRGLVKSSLTLIALAEAMNILSKAMQRLAGLKVTDLAQSIAGIWAGMKILTTSLKEISGVKVPIKAAASLLIVAETCKVLAKAMKMFSDMSWDEIGRASIGMGAALAEIVAAVKVLEMEGKNGAFGKSAVSGAASLVLVASSLKKIASAFKDFGSMNWETIKSASIGMGAALAEVVASIKILQLGKSSGFDSLLSAGSLKLVISSLQELAEAFARFAGFSVGESITGLMNLAGCLTIVAGITGILGEVTKGWGLLGAVSLKMVMTSMTELAESFEIFASLKPGEAETGLKAMGGALTELAVIEGLLGSLAGFSGLLGAISLDVGVKCLGDLADALQQLGSMSWDQINTGLVGMGYALAIMAGANFISGIEGFVGLLGAVSLDVGVKSLGDLAEALQKFGSMDWDSINRGLTAMGLAMGETAIGALLNSLSGAGATSLRVAAVALSALADAMLKWKDVQVPDNLGSSLAKIAGGVAAFTFDGLGAGTIAILGGSMKDFAEGVDALCTGYIPDNIGDKLSTIADGVKAFTLGGLGAGAISTVAPNLKKFAQGVQELSTGYIPDNLGEKLSTIASGVKAFTFGSNGAGVISEVAPSLKKFAQGIDALCTGYIPDDLGEKLASIGSAIKAFNWGGSGAKAIATVSEALVPFADGIHKMVEVQIPEDFGEKMKSLSDAMTQFNSTAQASGILAAMGPAFNTFADGIVKMVNITIPENFATNLGDIATNLNKFMNVTNLASTGEGMNSLADAIVKLNGVDLQKIASGLDTLGTSFGTFSTNSQSLKGVGDTIKSNIVKPLKDSVKSMDAVGKDLMSNIGTGISNNSGSITDAVNKAMKSAASGINISAFKSAGSKCAKSFASGIKYGASGAKTAARSMAKSAASSAKGRSSSFRTAGLACAEGFASGIAAGQSQAISAAVNMAAAAYAAAKKKLDVNSPSKLFRRMAICVPEGFAQGIVRGTKYVIAASRKMANTSIDTTKNALSKIASLNLDSINTDLTIRPVVDLSNVSAGADKIASMLNLNPSVGLAANLGAINSAMNSRNQNNSNQDVINALRDVKRAITKSAKPTYNINGITYDDGSNVSNAVSDLVRAVKVEGRV